MIRVLACHNYYQKPGGEDTSFALEADLLAARGHEVIRYTRHNDEIQKMSARQVARETLWSARSYADVQSLIRQHRPDVLHCTNTFPLISPSVYYAARELGVAVVQSLRNYRLLCPNAQFIRGGKTCEACLGKLVPYRAVVHRCYRGSRSASAVVAGMLTWHRLKGTWNGAVDAYYALTNASREKFIAGGFSPERVAVKPNFLAPAPVPGTGSGGYAVFVGRLSPEKGLTTLLEAWSQLPLDLPLKILGDGPLSADVEQAAARDARIEWLGHVSGERVQEVVGEAAFLAVPSLWYEGFPRTIVEAFALGTPVVASDLGSMSEIVDHGRTGLHFEPGNAAALANAIQKLMADSALRSTMRSEVRSEFESNYTAERNYDLLIQIYETALSRLPSQATTKMAAGTTW